MIDKRFFGEIKKIKASELAVICDLKVVGGTDFVISSVATLKNATSTDLSFFGNKKYREDLLDTKAGAVIIPEDEIRNLPCDVMALVSSNVMVSYAKALNVLCYPEEHLSHICHTAVISETAKIGSNCYIGDYVKIGDDVEIGDNTVIENNTVIEDGCIIGNNGLIRSNVTISHSIIGSNVIIHSGARIGESGFGIIPTSNGMVYIKQLGRVIIGDRVRIGANTTIDRGSIDDTVIGNDTIIDNLVQIGHNVKVGEASILVSQVGIAGSTTIGNHVILAGQVGVAGHITIGDGAIAAAKSGIASNVAAGAVVGGIPAVDAGIWKRQAAFLKMSVTKKKKK